MTTCMGLYTVYDSVAEQAGPLFEAINSEVAKRSYKNFILGLKNIEFDEYELWYVGDIIRNPGNVEIKSIKTEIIPVKIEV